MQRIYKPGQVEISFYLNGVGVTLPPELLGEGSLTVEEGEVETKTQAHDYKQGNGKLNATAKFVVFLPSIGYLGKILRSKYTAATDPSDPGVVIGKAGEPAGQDHGVFHIHPVSEENDKNDVHLYDAEVIANGEPKFSEDGAALSVELTFYGQPDSSGNIYRLGTGDLTQDVVYDPATNAYTSLES